MTAEKNVTSNTLNLNKAPPCRSIHINELCASDFNPPRRTTTNALKGLKLKIVMAGRVLEPLAVVCEDGAFAIVNGHRRYAVAKELGYTHLPCTVYPEGTSKPELYKLLNNSARTHTPNDWLDFFVRNGGSIKSLVGIPSSSQKSIKDALEIGGLPLCQELIDSDTSPRAAQFAKELVKKIGLCGLKLTPPLTARRIVDYIMNRGQMRNIGEALRYNNEKMLKNVAKRILKDEDILVTDISGVKAGK